MVVVVLFKKNYTIKYFYTKYIQVIILLSVLLIFYHVGICHNIILFYYLFNIANYYCFILI